MLTRSWQIGNVKVTRVVELVNVRWPDFVFRDLSPEAVLGQSWLCPDHAKEDGRLISHTQAFILDNGSTRIIVDTCVGNDKPRRNAAWNDLQLPFLDALTDAGYPPESISMVLCTHMHVDHVGWNTRLSGTQWVPTFRNARYLFGRREWSHWTQELGADIDGDVSEQVSKNVLEARAVYKDSVQPIVDAGLDVLVDSYQRLTNEIRLEPTPGHTPGHVSVIIESNGEKAVITGDMMHHPIQCALPDASSTFDFDIEQARATRRQFLQRHANVPVIVFGTHFAGSTAGLITSSGDTWRFDSLDD